MIGATSSGGSFRVDVSKVQCVSPTVRETPGNRVKPSVEFVLRRANAVAVKRRKALRQ